MNARNPIGSRAVHLSKHRQLLSVVFLGKGLQVAENFIRPVHHAMGGALLVQKAHQLVAAGAGAFIIQPEGADVLLYCCFTPGKCRSSAW